MMTTYFIFVFPRTSQKLVCQINKLLLVLFSLRISPINMSIIVSYQFSKHEGVKEIKSNHLKYHTLLKNSNKCVFGNNFL